MDEVKKYEPLFGSWYVERIIGEGSFGKVYALKKIDFGKEYHSALKIITIPQSKSEISSLRSEGMDDQSIKTHIASYVSSVVSEFDLMAKFRGNSNIVSLEDHLAIPHPDGMGFDILIRMELLTSLISVLERNEFTQKDVIQLGIDMCKALELCQKHNIIHRDIKPENIFVSDYGDYKLGDFGIARTVEKTTGEMSKKGTYTYMAPEIYKGEIYGSSVDIYSLGIVLYRLLNSNRTPFLPPYPAPITHTSREDALTKRMSGVSIPPPSGAKGRLSEIVMKAVAYTPRGRYESPKQMREELEAIQYSEAERPLVFPDGDHVDVPVSQYTYLNSQWAPPGNAQQQPGQQRPVYSAQPQPPAGDRPPYANQPHAPGQMPGHPVQPQPPVGSQPGYPMQQRPPGQMPGYPIQPQQPGSGPRQPMPGGAPGSDRTVYQPPGGMQPDHYSERTMIDPRLGLGGPGPVTPAEPKPKQMNIKLIIAIAAGAIVLFLLIAWAAGLFSSNSDDPVTESPTSESESPTSESPTSESPTSESPTSESPTTDPPPTSDTPTTDDPPPTSDTPTTGQPPNGDDTYYYDTTSKIYFEYPEGWYVSEVTGAQTYYPPIMVKPSADSSDRMFVYNYTTEYSKFLQDGGSGINDLIDDFATRFITDDGHEIGDLYNIEFSDPWTTDSNYECTKLIAENDVYYFTFYLFKTPAQQVGAVAIETKTKSAIDDFIPIYISFEFY